MLHTLNLYSITHQLYINFNIKINKQEGPSFSSLPSGMYSFSHGPQIIFYTQICFKYALNTHMHTQWYHTVPAGINLLFSQSVSWISLYASTYGANKVFCSKKIACCAMLIYFSHVQLFATPGSSVHGILQARNTGACDHALLQRRYHNLLLNFQWHSVFYSPKWYTRWAGLFHGLPWTSFSQELIQCLKWAMHCLRCWAAEVNKSWSLSWKSPQCLPIIMLINLMNIYYGPFSVMILACLTWVNLHKKHFMRQAQQSAPRYSQAWGSERLSNSTDFTQLAIVWAGIQKQALQHLAYTQEGMCVCTVS